MLVATPAAPALADRKPRVISEIRKAHVQRSPSLDGHPRLSGILNYYSDGFGIWTQRTVAVRAGSLLVYGADCGPLDHAPARSCASLGRPPSRRAPSAPRALYGCFDAFRDGAGAGAGALRKSADDLARLTPKTPLSGCNSLGRAAGLACGAGGAEFRLPLRHLNLMPSDLAPRAFCLSYRQNGSTPVAVFQALNRLEYERWVKTLAVEIMRQTPLDAMRFLDVLGIASIVTPSESPETPAKPAQGSGTVKITRGSKLSDTKVRACQIKRKTPLVSASRGDRSPSSEGSTTSADFISNKKSIQEGNSVIRSKRSTLNGQPLPRRKLRMSDVESQSDRDDVDCIDGTVISGETVASEAKQTTIARRSREKVRRTKDVSGNCSSTEETRAPDEGIVLEERGSSSDRSCRRNLWPSDRSDGLDSPRSVSSYSSCELCDSPDTVDSADGPATHVNRIFVESADTIDEPDGYPRNPTPVLGERVYCKNVTAITHQTNLIKKKCEKRISLEKNLSSDDRDRNGSRDERSAVIPKEARNEGERIARASSATLYRAQPFVDHYRGGKPEGPTRRVEFDRTASGPTDCPDMSPSERDRGPPSTVAEAESGELRDSKLWSRARSCSPHKESGRSPPRRPPSGRGARAMSAGQEALPGNVKVTVEALKQRCQSTEGYVPVKEKLALFESLCRAGRLARSSEARAAEQRLLAAPRARSMHDLSRSRSPHVPVREMCKFFEKFGSSRVCGERGGESSDIGCSQSLPNFARVVDKNSAPSPRPTGRANRERNFSSNFLPKNNFIPREADATIKSEEPLVPAKSEKMRGKVDAARNDVNFVENFIDQDSMNDNGDVFICEAFNFGSFKQIRKGNKIITYV